MAYAESIAVDHYWDGAWQTVPAADRRDTDPAGRRGGTALPALRDHHVHLGLIDTAALADSALSAVDDLGWIPETARHWQRHGAAGRAVRAVGPFLTKVGGYPFGRVWAPDEAVRQISSVSDAAVAAHDVAAAGFHACKVALNADMPLLDTDELQTIVRVAHDAGMPVVAHVEGAGQARRAFEAGVDVLAHAPWTELLDHHLIADMAGMSWISTLGIHQGGIHRGIHAETAAANTAAFHQSGGTVLYGTDMGNGTSDGALSRTELAALLGTGMDAHAVIASAVAVDVDTRITWSPLPPPRSDHDLIAWCQTLRSIPIGQPGGES